MALRALTALARGGSEMVLCIGHVHEMMRTSAWVVLSDHFIRAEGRRVAGRIDPMWRIPLLVGFVSHAARARSRCTL